MKSNALIAKTLKSTLPVLAIMAIGSSAFATDKIRQTVKPMAQKTVPCVNPSEPCNTGPIIFKASELSQMKSRDSKRQIQARLKKKFPNATSEALALNGEIISTVQRATMNLEDVGGDVAVMMGGCCSVEITIKISLGKK